MKNELRLFISLIEDEMVDFNALLIKNYKLLNITEKDIIILSSLERRDAKGDRTFRRNVLLKKTALEKSDFDNSLYSLTEKGYLVIDQETNPETGKVIEKFSLKNIYEELVNIYVSKSKENEKDGETLQEQIVNFYDEHYKKQMTPMDADIIRNWCQENMFTFEEIKNEMLDALKMGKTSLKAVDQALIKKRTIEEQSPEYKETSKIIEELKNKWKK